MGPKQAQRGGEEEPEMLDKRKLEWVLQIGFMSTGGPKGQLPVTNNIHSL